MSRASHQLTHLIPIDPAKAKKVVLQALRDAKMHMGNAAKALGCTHGTLLQWIARLDMHKDVEDLRAEAIKRGWHFVRTGNPDGRPPLSTAEKKRRAHFRELTPAIVEKTIGRSLRKHEYIKPIDGDWTNMKPSNLKVHKRRARQVELTSTAA